MPSSYLAYIRGYCEDTLSIARDWATVLVGAVWGVITSKFGGWWATSALSWLAIFWSIDFVLGSARAIHAGKWKARVALMSGTKLGVGSLLLLISYALKDSHIIGTWAISSLLDAVPLLAEISSVLIHVGQLTGNSMVLRLGLAFRRGSKRAAGKAMGIIDGKTNKEEEEVEDHDARPKSAL